MVTSSSARGIYLFGAVVKKKGESGGKCGVWRRGCTKKGEGRRRQLVLPSELSLGNTGAHGGSAADST